ncbi:MAG: AMP-binding protein [Myxococcales bacterium FL481]|nr:MAG: AMP-binding protein [Myxococcales bacterium FL481]
MDACVEQLFAHLHPGNHCPALVAANESACSYAELDDRTRRIATGFHRLGVQAGDRVAAYLAPGEAVVQTLLACHRLGAVFVPINRRYQDRELAHIVRDCRPALAVSDPDGLSALGRVVSPTPRLVQAGSATGGTPHLAEWPTHLPWEGPLPDNHDPALMIYTSGTTGASKGVVHSFSGLIQNIGALTRSWGFSGQDRLCLMLPLFHVHGLCIGIHGSLLTGNSVLLHERFEPSQVFRDFAERDATVFMGVPTMYARLVERAQTEPTAAAKLQRARLFTAGSAPLSPRLFAEFQALTGHAILERYGMSETLITLSNPLAGPRRPGTVGTEVEGCEVRIVDDSGRDVPRGVSGELLVRGPSLMLGYWDHSRDLLAPVDDDGWFATGDVAQQDSGGYVRILGRRTTDLIKSGGYRIAARELEEVLLEHPTVDEVAVIGVPDVTWGERIVAVVVAETADEPSLSRALREHCREQLADYKCPRGFVVRRALPRNALGKLQKHELVAELAAYTAE